MPIPHVMQEQQSSVFLLRFDFSFQSVGAEILFEDDCNVLLRGVFIKLILGFGG